MPEDWHDQLRWVGARRCLWLALATFVCSVGYPGVVALVFEPTGPGRHDLAIELFVRGGILVSCFFVFGACLTMGRR